MKKYSIFLLYYTLFIAFFTLLLGGLIPDNFKNPVSTVFLMPMILFFVHNYKMLHNNTKRLHPESNVEKPYTSTWAHIPLHYILIGMLLTGLLYIATYNQYTTITTLKSIEQTQIGMINEIARQKSINATLENNKKSQVLGEEIKRIRKDIKDLKFDSQLLSPILDLKNDPVNDSISSLSADLYTNSESGYLSLRQDKIGEGVRKDPNPTSPIIGKIKYGSSYKFLSKENEYYRVALDSNSNKTGWINSRYVNEL